jgi:ketosteroid isomerase-like protein
MRHHAGLTRGSRLLLAAACLGTLGCAAASDGSNGEAAELSTAEVLATLQALDEAVRQKDTATIAGILTDDYTYLSSRGGVRSRDWLLRDLLGHPSYRLDYSERGEVQVSLYGATAVVSSRWRGEGTYNGEPVRDDQRCSLVMVKDSGRVRVAMEHCTQIVP